QEVASPREAPPKRQYAVVTDETALDQLLNKLQAAKIASIEALTEGAEPTTVQLVGLAFAFEREAYYLPLAHDHPEVENQIDLKRALDKLGPWLTRDDGRKAGRNVKLAGHALANRGVRLATGVHDTVLESYVLEAHERRDLVSMARRHCAWTITPEEELTGKGANRISFSSVDIGRAGAYAAEAADCTLALHEVLIARINADDKLKRVYDTIELPVLPVLERMERNGVLLDARKLEAQSHELGKEILDKEK